MFKKDHIYYFDECIGFTTRHDGVSKSPYDSNNLAFQVDDNKEDVLKNRINLASKLNFTLDDFVFAEQKHTDNFLDIKNYHKGQGTKSFESGIKDTDALYTFEKNIVLACFYADCTPVYFRVKSINLIGVIHAGWMGTQKEITKKTLSHIISTYDFDLKDLEVYIGPSIMQRNYEVKKDVYDAFIKTNELYKKYFKFENEKYFLDNSGINKQQCLDLNISNITISNLCTTENNEFFSFRKEGVTGRMVAFIYQI